jgi:hypothetical protein
VKLAPSEEVVGVYASSNGAPGLVVTTLGVRAPSNWGLLPYESMVNIGGPAGKAELRPRISITCADRQVVSLEIDGFQGKFQDVWAFVRFLDRASTDVAAT